MRTCESCGGRLVAPEEMNAHARGVCAGLEVPPPPDLTARIRHARAQEAKAEQQAANRRAYLERLARRAGGRGAAIARTAKRDELLARFEDWRAKSGGLLQGAKAARAFFADDDPPGYWDSRPEREQDQMVENLLDGVRKRRKAAATKRRPPV